MVWGSMVRLESSVAPRILTLSESWMSVLATLQDFRPEKDLSQTELRTKWATVDDLHNATIDLCRSKHVSNLGNPIQSRSEYCASLTKNTLIYTRKPVHTACWNHDIINQTLTDCRKQCYTEHVTVRTSFFSFTCFNVFLELMCSVLLEFHKYSTLCS